eukprot:CAMPEP_0113281322 /NCGR_PEP_ID=MMETSP0008_2-20120614/28235_1 /TAXON_ID=97485 /ORGANISM="Prymnesium parvum" /LENGTH=62 /DNA_ID=CAMNT_0000131723 /DNA_START=72 /DNA_END=257 /DNA_ORIENTATION=- /assembly_acc=CAM_ASM_000153
MDAQPDGTISSYFSSLYLGIRNENAHREATRKYQTPTVMSPMRSPAGRWPLRSRLRHDPRGG